MFLGLTQQLKLPDPWQHDAVHHLRNGSDVIVSAPTGAGKTFIFELLVKAGHFKRQVVYTVPTRALANDKYAEWKQAGWQVGLATGDLALDIHAPVLVATLETQIERLIAGNGPALLVIDEYQMIADPARGSHYEGAVILTPSSTQLLLLSGSVENPKDLAGWMERLGRKVEVVSTFQRPVPLEDFPIDYHQPRFKSIEGRWSKLVTAVLMADLAPLLIFAPRRKDAEAIAAKLATHLPQGEPLSLTPEQRSLAGKEFAAMLERRVACHHSGLPYALRAGLVEPLAKAGQLRVIVSTMGLAAGINFSVRSVHVSGTTFHDGVTEQQLTADELLQMFGRAGRRGLDERGYVITTRESPTLADARPARLKRSNKLSWPLFLRVMQHAHASGTNPFEAATEFAEKMFAKQAPDLGLQPSDGFPIAAMGHPALFGLKAILREILNSQGRWEAAGTAPVQKALLGDTWFSREGYQGLTLSSTRFVNALSPAFGRLCKLPGTPLYGREVALGAVDMNTSLSAGEKNFQISDLELAPHLRSVTQSLRKMLKIPPHVTSLSDEKLRKVALPKLQAHFPDASLFCLMQRGDTLWAVFDFSNKEVETVVDSQGRLIFDPLIRVSERESHTDIAAETHRVKLQHTRPGSALHSWRSLGLIESDGHPTRRGIIFSFFQQGEGLAIAAALEDESYPIDDILPHLANLRGDKHIDFPEANPSERLSAVCRSTYGFVNHHGYMEGGLPLGYGEATAELLFQNQGPGEVSHRLSGDLSRAYIEWLSLLRHLSHAPEYPWPRWQELKAKAAELLKQHLSHAYKTLHPDLPTLTPKQRHERPVHFVVRRAGS